MTTKTFCQCGHPISDHTYSEDYCGCDVKGCACSLDLGGHIDTLVAKISEIAEERNNLRRELIEAQKIIEAVASANYLSSVQSMAEDYLNK